MNPALIHRIVTVCYLTCLASFAAAAPLYWNVTNPTPAIGEQVILQPGWDGLKAPWALMFEYQEPSKSPAWIRLGNICYASPCQVPIYLKNPRATTMNFRAFVINRNDRTQRAVQYAARTHTVTWHAVQQQPPTTPPAATGALALHLRVNGVSCDVAAIPTNVNHNTSSGSPVIQTQKMRDANGNVGDYAKLDISYTTTGYANSGYNFSVKLYYGSTLIPGNPFSIQAGQTGYYGGVVNFTPRISAVTAYVEWDGQGSSPTSRDHPIQTVACYVPLTFKQ
jgi:hypothetical protein